MKSSKSSKVNRAWINDHVNDPWVKLATKEGYRARAAYKLKEIDEVFSLVKPGQLVVDLGSTPGAWSQYLRRRLGNANGPAGATSAPNGTIIALDLLPMEPVEGVTFFLGDFREDAVLQQVVQEMAGRKADLVVSDMAPNLSGIDSADQARSVHLGELALEFAVGHLSPGGALLVKVFQGAGLAEFQRAMAGHFTKVYVRKPKSSRDRSRETFLVGKGLRG